MKNARFMFQKLFLLGVMILACTGSDKTILGTWKMIPEKSTNIQTWRYRHLEVDIRQDAERIIILQNWLNRDKVAFVDSVSFLPGGDITPIPVTSYIWPENWYMGVLSKLNSIRKVSGKWTELNKSLTTEVEQVVEVSQGDATITTIREFNLSRDGKELTITEKRSSRPAPIQLVFQRVEK